VWLDPIILCSNSFEAIPVSYIIHEILAGMADASSQTDTTDVSLPDRFAEFLADRGTRKPSLHTMKAYRQDFDAIATVISGGDAGDVSRMSLGDTTTDTVRTAFAQAKAREALSSADVFSVRLPHTDDTRKLLNAGRLARLPHGALVIDVGHGEVIVEPALLAVPSVGSTRPRTRTPICGR